MNYIYDILVNWNTILYDFYEWEINDEITHIRKIPIFKVNTNILLELERSKICIDSEFLSKIYRRGEIFTNKNIKSLDYISLFSDGESVLAIKFNETGTSIAKSKLLIDEEEEVLEVVLRMPESQINYNIIKEEVIYFKTRKEIERENYLKKQLHNLKKEDSIEKLKYLYYECFDEKIEEKTKMLNRFEIALKENRTEITKKMEQFFKLTSSHR